MTEPCSNGLGADNFAIVWDPESRRLHGLNSSGTAPAAWTPQYFRRKYREQKIPLRGWDTVTVPGAVAGWSLLHGKFGKRTFADVLAPAIEYAERGFAISPTVQDKWVRATPLLRDLPGFAEHFLQKGRPPRVGEHFVLPGAARTLKLIADTRGEAFYKGEIADAIERFAQTTGGAITGSDLSGYWDFVQSHGWVGTISTSFHGMTCTRFRPTARYRRAELPRNSAPYKPSPVRGGLSRLAPCDDRGDEARVRRYLRYVGDPRSMTVTSAEMLNDDYLSRRSKLIDSNAQPTLPPANTAWCTIYLSAADASGMMVSFIQSNYMGFGSGVVVPGYGISCKTAAPVFRSTQRAPIASRPESDPFTRSSLRF